MGNWLKSISKCGLLQLPCLLTATFSACICCDPANTTGYHCPQTYSIIKKKTKRDTESWHSNMVRGDKFREIGILHHEECLGCYKFIPSKFPDVGSRCSCCDSYSCDNITPGGCTRNFSVAQLGCEQD